MEKKPTDYIEECKWLQQFYEKNAGADEVFKMQKHDIQAISKYKWYKHIKEFFMRQYNDWLVALQSVDSNNKCAVANIQWTTALSKKFLDYLNVREK